MVMPSRVAALLLLAGVALADHPCTSEVASACPDRPGSDVAACLKDTESHDTVTQISSECTDYIAINTACAEDIEKKCDEAFFTDDTIPCLTQWNEREDLTERCQGVLKWAVPEEDEELDDLDEATDELGLTEDEAKEKDEEWRARRKAARGDAIERLKMKEADRKKEEDRVALEEFKKSDPEGYAAFIQQQEEEAKQKAEFARLERMRAAAWERKKRQEAGLSEDGEEPPKEAKKSKKQKKQATEEESADFGGAKAGTKKKGGSLLYSLFSFAFVGLVVYVVYYLAVVAPSQPGTRSGRGSGKKGKKSR